MRMKIYQILVNRHVGIAQRYARLHNKGTKIKRLLSYVYLLWLNFAYYFLFCRKLGDALQTPIYEEKHLPIQKTESVMCKRAIPWGKGADGVDLADVLIEKLSLYDIISFDIFDTLIFRPFSEPSDLFYILGQKLNYMDFKRIRVEAEWQAREKMFKKTGLYEVGLGEIWEQVSLNTGIDASVGMQLELETELDLCYANPFMLRVFDSIRDSKKRIIITTDMYLPENFLHKLLIKNGYHGYEKLFLSRDYGKSKENGKLFTVVKETYGEELRFAHVGDNVNSDIKQSKKQGYRAFYYPNVNANSLLYRTYDISPLIGSAYRGIVNNRLHCGKYAFNQNYEFGYVYGGIFVLGYCNFIYQYVKNQNIEKLMFFSRDGYILHKAYNIMYPLEKSEYVYISRFASAKWSAKYLKYDYIRKMVRHRCGDNLTIMQVLRDMGLSQIADELSMEFRILVKKKYGKDIDGCKFKLEWAYCNDFIETLNLNWDKIIDIYDSECQIAGEYYSGVIGDAKTAVAVDIGWAGSSAIALRTLFEKEWNIPCALTGIIAGTNTVNSIEPDINETMRLDGSMVTYLYSPGDNRDLYKKHNPARLHNIYFELLTSSEQPSFTGFEKDIQGNIIPKFGKLEKNSDRINDIQDGILDFIADYSKCFEKYPYMHAISGRDAYAPMLLAMSKNERYLRHIYKSFDFTIGINTES